MKKKESENTELWRQLKVGDKVRLFEAPREFLREGYGIHEETLWVYKKLVERRRPLRVYEIDAWGLPWVKCNFFRQGKWEYHYLAFNHGGLVRVKPRTKTGRSRK